MANNLPLEVKKFIVKQLACYDTPSEVAAMVKEEFEIDLQRGNINAYNPLSRQGRQLSKRLKLIFFGTRKRFESDIQKLPLANPIVRVSELSKFYYKARDRNNFKAAATYLKQIQDETTGSKIKLVGGEEKDGDKPVQVAVTASRIAELRNANKSD